MLGIGFCGSSSGIMQGLQTKSGNFGILTHFRHAPKVNMGTLYVFVTIGNVSKRKFQLLNIHIAVKHIK